MTFTFKQIINLIAIAIIGTLSLYHFLLFTGRIEIKKEWYNLLFSITGICTIGMIISISFLKPGIWNIFFINLFLLLMTTMVIVTTMNLVTFPSLGKIINYCCVALMIINLLITVPILWHGREWFFKNILFPGVILTLIFSWTFIINQIACMSYMGYWKHEYFRYILIGFLLYGLHGALSMTGQLTKQPFFTFFQENYIMYIFFYWLFAYSLSIKANIEFEDTLETKNNLEERVKKRTEELDFEKESKTQFFINLAHDTKTPLTLINSYVNKIIKKHNSNDDDIIGLQKNIKKLTQNMINFLDSERLIKGSMDYNHNKVTPISDLLKEQEELFKNICLENGLNFSFSVEDNLFVKSDPTAIERIINNLFDNSLKFTNIGRIGIKLILENNKIVLSVTDTGCGIPELQLNNIFTPYYQLKQKKKSNQGSGMGLSIVNNLLNEIDAEIKIKSSIEKGSIFTIYFNPYQLKENDITDFELQGLEVISSKKNIPLYKPKNQNKRKNILLVEDDRELLNSMAISLNNNYNISIALNGLEAKMLLDDGFIPDFIISDLMMDEMDGDEFYNQVRNSLKLVHVPFIFVTACTELDNRLKALNDGVIDYIYKPFSNDELIARLKGLDLFNAALQEVMKYELINKLTENIDRKCLEAGITSKEREIIDIIIARQTLNEEEIAKKLKIAPKTVYNHVINIKNKLGTSREKLIARLTDFKDNSQNINI